MTIEKDGCAESVVDCDDAIDGGNVFEGGDLPPLEELPVHRMIDFDLVRINAWDSLTTEELESHPDKLIYLRKQLLHDLDKKIAYHDYIRVTEITEDHSWNQRARLLCDNQCPGYVHYWGEHTCPDPIFAEHLYIAYARAIYVGDQDFEIQHRLRKYFARHKHETSHTFKLPVPTLPKYSLASSVSLEQAQKLLKTGAKANDR